MVDLKLDRSTISQEKALAEFRAWANELVTQQRFRISLSNDCEGDYTITLLREEDVPTWLRMRIEARLYVEEDQRDRRVLSRYSELLVDGIIGDDEKARRIGTLRPFTPANIAKARKSLSLLLR